MRPGGWIRKRFRLVITVIVLLIIIIAGSWWYFGFRPQGIGEESSAIFASGFIEAKDVAIASEVAGRIIYIAVDEGDKVEAGVPLVKLDDSLLKAQQYQAETALKSAQAGLEQAIASRDQAIVARDGAKKIWENALDVQANPLELEARIIAAQGELDMAELNLEHVLELTIPDWWQEQSARLRRDTAQNVLDNLLLIKANPQEINAAVDQAQAAYDQAAASVEVAEKAVAVAETQVEQAKAALEVIDVQLNKLTLSSPISGVVANQHVEVGEMAQPGLPILTVTELEEVTLTAYVAESKLGLVKLGQEAHVSVDSYPEENFSGTVSYISPHALFTPRNIQMKEEREKTVFAVKIKLANPEGRLKPGMPADAWISVSSGTP